MNWSEKLASAQSFTSDSRAVRAGDVFVALKGAQSDGHAHIAAALGKGALYAVCRKDWKAERGVSEEQLLRVEETTRAHREIAGYFRSRFRGRVIAVGGSSGKTSTKEFLADILGEKFSVIRTERSQNGELGIPKTLEKLRSDVEVAVVEVGIDAPGDMDRHAHLVQPDIAVLTSIGEEHLNLLKTLEQVFREEFKLIEVTLARKGLGFVAGADPWLRRLEGTEGIILVPGDPTLFSVKMAEVLREKLPNDYAVQNATLAIFVARALGMKEEEITQALARLKVPEGRGQLSEGKKGALLILDHYNSNPSSLRAALTSAQGRARREKRSLWLILGDMLDLGEQSEALHRQMLAEIHSTQPEKVFFVGPEWMTLRDEVISRGIQAEFFPTAASAQAALQLADFSRKLILLKGSRGMALEKIIPSLK